MATAPATGDAYKRSAEICEELNDTRQIFPVLYGLCLYHLYGAELAEAATAADRLLRIAQPSGNRDLAFFANRAVGVTALPAGNFGKARDHLDRVALVRSLDDVLLGLRTAPRLAETAYPVWQITCRSCPAPGLRS